MIYALFITQLTSSYAKRVPLHDFSQQGMDLPKPEDNKACREFKLTSTDYST